MANILFNNVARKKWCIKLKKLLYLLLLGFKSKKIHNVMHKFNINLET